jgi:hypothetical protein
MRDRSIEVSTVMGTIDPKPTIGLSPIEGLDSGDHDCRETWLLDKPARAV